jgi:ABC-2 type transport system permease protein
MLILIVASSLLFNLWWGSPVAVLILVMASVTGAVGWGMIIMAVAKTAGQVGAVGSAIMLTFGILGGSFFQVNLMPSWFRIVRTITPNAWSIDGFTILARGGGLQDIAGVIVPLLVMGISLFAVAVYILNRRGFVEA